MLEELGFASRFVSGKIEPHPAVTATPPRPAGDLGRARIDRIAQLAATTWEGAPVTCHQRGQAASIILTYLAEHPGRTWQQRWDASPLGRGEAKVSILGTRRGDGIAVGQGLRSLFCLRVIQPSLLAFRMNNFHEYGQFFVAAQGDPLLDTFAEQVPASDLSWAHRREALFDVCCLLTVQGVNFTDLTPAAVLHYGHDTRRARAILLPGRKASNRFAGLSAWNILHQRGYFPPETPSTMRAALARGQLSIEQSVDRYPIRNHAVRQLLIDYFTRRSADTDHASISHMVLEIAHHFWEKIERINPDQPDLRIALEVYATWRHMIATREDGPNAGKPRAGVDGIVICVRSFYYDLHTWASDEPERWARWVAPCPVPPSEIRRPRQATPPDQRTHRRPDSSTPTHAAAAGPARRRTLRPGPHPARTLPRSPAG